MEVNNFYWHDKTEHLVTETEKKLRDQFGVEIASADFQRESGKARKQINGTIVVAVSRGGAGAGSGNARRRGPIVIDINQPSQYFLVHKPSNEILFPGNLDDPTSI